MLGLSHLGKIILEKIDRTMKNLISGGADKVFCNYFSRLVNWVILER